MFDFKKIIHQTKPLSDPRNVTWFELSIQKFIIYSGSGGSAKYGKAEEIFRAILTNCSVTSNSGNSSNTVMSSNLFLHELQSFGGDIHARPPAANCSVNSVSGNSSTMFRGAYMGPPAAHCPVKSVSGNRSATFGRAYARPPAAYSHVFTRPPRHNSNPFVVVNLNNKIKKCAGGPFPFRDEQGPIYLGFSVKHVEKNVPVYIDKASDTQRVAKEGNRYYHCQVSCITSRHPYFSPATLRADPDLLLDDFQRYSLNSVFVTECVARRRCLVFSLCPHIEVVIS